MKKPMLKPKFILNIDNYIVISYLLYAIYSMIPYFSWTTFQGGRFSTILGLISFQKFFAILAIGTAIFRIIIKPRIDFHNFMLGISLVFLTFYLLCIAGLKFDLFSGSWISYLAIVMFIFMPKQIQTRTLRYFTAFFAISLIPSMIYYIITVFLKMSLPYTRLESYEIIKVKSQYFYKESLLTSQLWTNRSDVFCRYSGIYDEAGRLGTVAALLLTVNDCKVKGNHINQLLLVAGCLSLSLAFFMIVVVYIIINNLLNGKRKSILILGGVIMLYLVFMRLDLSNTPLQSIQERMVISSNGLEGDNRTGVRYKMIFSQFQNSDLLTKLFGHGLGAMGEMQLKRMADGSSYKSLIYDFGYLGFGMYLIWLTIYTTVMAHHYRNSVSKIWTLYFLQLANMYQRPSFAHFPFLLVFISGIATCDGKMDEKVNSRVLCDFLHTA